jgi:hypothetical protein
MTRDPKQTQTLEEPMQHNEPDVGMRTTLVQPIPLSRRQEFVRTRYWEKLSSDAEPAKPTAAGYASASKTCVGLGPDDPIVQAVQAAKQQLLEAERAQQERPSHERPRVAAVASASSASSAKTVLLPALEVLQLMASRVKPKPNEPEDAVVLPKRRLKPLLIGAGALGVILCAAGLDYLMPASVPVEQAQQSIVKPKPAAATETPKQQSGAVFAAASVNSAAPDPQLPQVSEKAAVDALFAGDYSLAGRHYAALASAHPEQPAFSEAARILKRNVRPDMK